MKSFKLYIYENYEMEPNSGNDVFSSEQPKDDILNRIIKKAWEGHKSETKSFLNKLASRDNDIADLMKDLEQEPQPDQETPEENMDDVVPPESDGQSDPNLDIDGPE